MQHLRYDESQFFHPVHNRCTLSGPYRTYSLNGLWLCKGIARRHCSCQFFHHGRRCGVLPKLNFRPSVAPNPSSASSRLTPTAPTKSVKAFTSRITRNKIMHALNGNIIWFERRTPPPRNYLWRQSFYIPNGMCIFRFSFYSEDSLWLYAHRRGSSFEIETTRRESPYPLWDCLQSGGLQRRRAGRPLAIGPTPQENVARRVIRPNHLRYEPLTLRGQAKRLPTPRSSRGYTKRYALLCF